MKKTTERLEKIKDRIEAKYGSKRVWFYPKKDLVDGYIGNQDIIFIGPNPSLNDNLDYTPLFYKQLKLNGFCYAHLTDLIKTRMLAKKAKEVLKSGHIGKEWVRFLKDEFKIINPRLIVILGIGENGCMIKDTIIREMPSFGNNLLQIRHYCWAGRFPKNRKLFEKEMALVKQKYLLS